MSLTHIRMDDRTPLLEGLRGQTLRIPDLASLLYPDWTVERHLNESQIRQEILEEFGPRWYRDSRKLQILRDGDFVQLAAYFWAGSSLERFRAVAQFANWYFPWDDEIDCGKLRFDQERTIQYGRDTVSFLKWCLEPESYYPNRLPRPVFCTEHHTDCFEEIGVALQRGQSKEALRRYADSMYQYVAAVCDVQKQREVCIPRWEDYVEGRLDTIGVYPCLMAMEYAYDLSIPSWVYEHEAMTVMFRETSISIFMINDIYSLKKEVAVNQSDSAVPLKMHHDGHINAQIALDEVIGDLTRSRKKFVAAEQRLLCTNQYNESSDNAKKDIQYLIRGCKNMMVGNIKWS
ncbi:hypothetical protein ANOM_007998 [Aspergillus nomiae NRRL 13137]|uniref:Terpene synthase n=1 Tax=Aspergillus nomiae NRRL (strain ATCC 15546 / NRRL 13137 / CBS 260.88 / M93) TaxID=1509407 RepID=A0A0L1IWC8_ASPN3|nr:uncharacterized protein ANOM_007998 [Aspergillus nomiae NRRL 13137]KNG83802.1 hypothetical protein ANOM_007998 [Aspergillus nomiae NRRL 13137]